MQYLDGNHVIYYLSNEYHGFISIGKGEKIHKYLFLIPEPREIVPEYFEQFNSTFK